MNEFKLRLSSKTQNIALCLLETDDLINELEAKSKNCVLRAKEILQKKHVINPKPQKRFMRIIRESDDSTTERTDEILPATPPLPAIRNNIEPVVPLQPKSPQRESLRPVRTAKANASKNLKEVSTNAKLRNDNNVAVIIKSERISAANKKIRDSLKENARPNLAPDSVDKSIQMGSEPDLAPGRDIKRSMSVEIIPSSKPIEIDITTDDSADKMPPPPIPGKKKKAQKQSSQEDGVQPLRVTRSKIKKEKPSIEKAVSSKELQKPADYEEHQIQKSISESVLQDQTQKVLDSTAASKKGFKKKYPMPIIVKLEKLSIEHVEETALPSNVELPSPQNDENIPPVVAEMVPIFPMNETVTINTNLPVNETVTLANNPNETYNKNMHDSLMTEDNDEETSMELPLAQVKENKKPDHHPQLPFNLKTKNEVFNPYLSSPVKQKVQAFEKHAVTTPDKSKATTSKYSTLKSGTPSKIALYGAKNTPLNNAKQKYIAAISGSASSSTTSLSSNKKTSAKKYTSLSHDSNDDLRKNPIQTANQLEEKRKQREEKQRQVQLQREAIEKQKREQTLQQQREREEKFRKIMQEKEEAKRMEALKKKMIKENQEKKYAEEKARKEEFTLPKEPQSASKDDSLYIKMQKQIILEKSLSQKKKKVDKNTYCFEMLCTDDSTDDESHPSKKRPEPPQWSKKQVRGKNIFVQSYANSHVLDKVFSSHPINVNLKEIFPTIDARKLIRNSSAVWNTPPRYSQMPKY